MRARVAALVVLVAAVSISARGAETLSDLTLANGLRVVLIPHHANPMVASAVVVRAGVVDETAATSGASHFLEHLLFNGTTTRSQRELYDAADRIGAYNNATTREDHTLFTILAPTVHAEEALAIQADMLFRSTLPAENFEKERKIVLEEMARDRSDPDYDREVAFRAAALAETPLARPVLGTEASLGGITREAVLAYYRERYVASNMTLVVMGDFEPAAMLEAVKRTFGGAPRRPAPRTALGRWPERPAKNLARAEAGEPPASVRLALPFDADPWDRRAAAADVLLAALSDGPDAPLRSALARRGITEEASLELERRIRPWSTVVFHVDLPDAAHAAPALDALAETIRGARQRGVGSARGDRALTRAEADAALARDQIHYFAMLRGDRIVGAPRGAIDGESAMLATLGAADREAALDLLESGLRTARGVVAVPGAAEAPVSWEPGAPPPPAAPAARVKSGTLSNGVRYSVRSSDDSDVFALHVAFAPRAAAEPDGRDGIVDLLHRAMVRATIVHPAAALEARLADLGARVKAVDDPSVPFDDYYTTSEFSWIRLEAPARSWAEAVGLVAEMIRFPDLSPASLDAARRPMLSLVERRTKSPRETGAAKLDALLAPGHPLSRPVMGSAESLGAVTVDEWRACHDGLATAARTVLAVDGPVDVEDVVAVLQSSFGAMPAGSPLPPAAAPPRTTASRAEEITLGATQSWIGLARVFDVPDADRAALRVAVSILSDRLAFDLRETRGLAYSIGAALRPWGDAMRLDLTMGTRPDNIETAVAGLTDALRAFQETPPSADEVARAVEAMRGRALMRRMTRISLAYEATLEMLRGEAQGDERRAIEALSAVDADRVRDATRRYLAPEPLVRVVVR